MSMKTQKAQHSRCCLCRGTEKGNRWPRGIVSPRLRGILQQQRSPSLTHRAGKPAVCVPLSRALALHEDGTMIVTHFTDRETDIPGG